MIPYKGAFTLIEVLIALLVFSIIATITSSAMFYAFDTRKRINIYADKLSVLQLAVHLIEQDTAQMVDRPTRGDNMRLFPSFTGTVDYMEFTRTGFINPKQLTARSTLKRVAYHCLNNTLIRRSWAQLDSPQRLKYEDRVILTNLIGCNFKYLDNKHQKYDEWLATIINTTQEKQPLPSLIEFTINMNDWGSMRLFLAVPEALYANVF